MTAQAGVLETYRGVVYPWHIDQIGHITNTRRSVLLPPDILKRAHAYATP